MFASTFLNREMNLFNARIASSLFTLIALKHMSLILLIVQDVIEILFSDLIIIKNDDGRTLLSKSCGTRRDRHGQSNETSD